MSVKRKVTVPVGRAAMRSLLEARVRPSAIIDVRRDLLAFLEDYFLGCHRFRSLVRPFSSCRSVSEEELIEFLEATLRKR
jgi:hypothetical protein